MSKYNRPLKNSPFTFRQAQGERRSAWKCWSFSVHAEHVEACEWLFQQSDKAWP